MRPANAAPQPPRPGSVTALRAARESAGRGMNGGEPPATDDGPATVHPIDRSQMHDVIESAIEQALDAVDPDDTRAETAGPDTMRPTARRETPPRPQIEHQNRREPPQHQPAPPARPAAPARSLLSPRTDAAVTASFEDLSRVLSGHGVDQTVENLLRPMLKSWLDDHLPPLVEKLVREEIERVSRGRR